MFAPGLIQGRWLSAQDFEALQQLIAEHPHWSRRRLSIALCEALNWRTASGQLKDMSARLLLNKLAQRGFIKLPPRQRSGGRQILRALSEPELFSLSAEAGELIEGPLRTLQPLEVIAVEARTAQANAFVCHLAQHHYLGFEGATGQNLRYLVRDCYGRDLACVLFGAAAWKAKARDSFIGWSAQQRQQRLCLIINNSRFLILPHVRVPHLASHILGTILRRLRSDWQLKYHIAPCLAETFVERERFAGICYRAANWLRVGQTSGRSRYDRNHTVRVPVKDNLPLPALQRFQRAALRMKVAAALLRQWHSENPARLLQAALWQAERLAELAPELKALRDQNISLHQQLEAKTKRIAQLEEALEASERAAHRQAAPFRIEEKKRALAPKRPGRKRGHPGAFRDRPDHIDEAIEVPLCSCPHCGGIQFKDQNAIEQLIEDIPSLGPHVTRLTTYQGTCVGCGQSVRSKHPLQMSLAIGAARVQLGPRALALAADLNKAKGLSMRKTCAVLRDCFGLQLSPGGLSQALDRLAVRVKPQYDALATELRQAPALHSDETSWWVAGPGWWLWVFTTQLLTFYVVAQSRGRELLSNILGKDFGGVLVSDCLAIYDDATALQQKCYAHHYKAIRQAKALHPHQGEGFLCEVQARLRAAVALQQQKADLSLEIFSDLRQALQRKAVQLLEPPRREPNEEAVRKRLNKQRDHLFTFLDHDGVDATNNLAERQLRPAVIARKISCGNKTQKGARTWQILTSLAATCAQRATSFIAEIARAAPLQAR